MTLLLTFINNKYSGIVPPYIEIINIENKNKTSIMNEKGDNN